jgi:hypothetical protein
MNWSRSLQPASLADAMINNYAFENLADINAGAYPGLLDLDNMFKSLLSQPFTKQAGGGVENVGYRNQLAMGQYNPARGQLAGNALDLENMFANLLAQGAGQLTDINTAITRGRGSNQGGLLGTFGL